MTEENYENIMNLNLSADYTYLPTIMLLFPFFLFLFLSSYFVRFRFALFYTFFTFSHVKRLKDTITTIATYNLNVKTSYPDLIVRKVS